MEDQITKLEEQVAKLASALEGVSKALNVVVNTMVHHKFITLTKPEDKLGEDIQTEDTEKKDGAEA